MGQRRSKGQLQTLHRRESEGINRGRQAFHFPIFVQNL
jgi:hypothetical protein